jgi:hypothetical protein
MAINGVIWLTAQDNSHLYNCGCDTDRLAPGGAVGRVCSGANGNSLTCQRNL